MEWASDGLVLAVRPHGENSAILDLFTRDQGRHAGIVRGGTGRRMSPVLMPGNQVQATWRARLDGQLGQYSVELARARTAALLSDRLALAGLSSVCALIARALPEREPHPGLYDATLTLIDAMAVMPDWPQLYLRWECGLLTDLGFGLDLSACAVTGATEALIWVSPRSGRAVSATGGRGYEDRLLPLPPCLLQPGRASPAEMAAALRLTGHFLHKGLESGPHGRPLPEARARLVDMLSRV